MTTSIKADVVAVYWSGAFRCVLTHAAAARQTGNSYKAISQQLEVHHNGCPSSLWSGASQKNSKKKKPKKPRATSQTLQISVARLKLTVELEKD